MTELFLLSIGDGVDGMVVAITEREWGGEGADDALPLALGYFKLTYPIAACEVDFDLGFVGAMTNFGGRAADFESSGWAPAEFDFGNLLKFARPGSREGLCVWHEHEHHENAIHAFIVDQVLVV